MRKYFNTYLWFILASVLLFLPQQVWSSPENIKQIEQQVGSLLAKIDSVDVLLSDLQKDSDSLAVLINHLKQKGALSFFEKRRLRELLRESQALTQRQKRAFDDKEKLTSQIIRARQQLLVLYRQQVDSLLSYLEREPQVPIERKKHITEQVRRLRLKQERLKKQLAPPGMITANGPIPIAATDTPAEIKAKADFYRDLRDKIRHKASLVSEKIKNLHQEAQLRRRLTQLIDDERLFDQRDESVARALPETRSTSAPEALGIGAGREKFFENRNVPADLSAEAILATTDQLLQFDPQSLASDEMDYFLDQLEKERRRLLTVADSLNQIASQYDHQAKELRNSLGRKPE